jgi:hypothetical protein
MNILSVSHNTVYSVLYDDEQYRVSIFEDGRKWIDWVVIRESDEEEVDPAFAEEIITKLEKIVE